MDTKHMFISNTIFSHVVAKTMNWWKKINLSSSHFLPTSLWEMCQSTKSGSTVLISPDHCSSFPWFGTMSFVNTLKQWDEAVACFERGDSAASLGTFLDIQEKNSKILFNVGCLHLINKNLDAAEKVWQLLPTFIILERQSFLSLFY